MILRLGALALLVYCAGFFLFSTSLGQPAAAERTAAIVVLTGGKGRIERGMDLLREGQARRLLVSGADPSVTKADLVRRLGARNRRFIQCCVDLGSEAVDTRSNAEEARRWMTMRRYDSMRLVTSDWHMRRAAYEFRSDLPDVRIVEDAVPSRPSLVALFLEYNKYVLRRAALWLDV